MVVADGVGAIVRRLSDYLSTAEDTSSYLITRRALGLPAFEKRGNITVQRIGLDAPKFISSLPRIGGYARKVAFSLHFNDARFLYDKTFLLDSVSEVKRLADEVATSPMLKDVDVFHCHGVWSNFETYIGHYLSTRLKKPLIFQLQGHFGPNVNECMNLDRNRPWYDPVIGNAALNGSTVIICGNKSTIEIMKKRTLSRVRFAFIPTCIDTRFFHPKNGTGSSKDVLFVGRLTEFKDPLTAVRAMKIVADSKPDVRLRILGGGPLTRRIQSLVEVLGLEKNVIMLGERPETKHFYQESAIFVAMSPIENFASNCILEAMACGLTVIATDVGETRELITDGRNGVLIPPRDPEALANAILSAFSNPSFYSDLSRNAIETAKQYDINVLGAEYARLYREVSSEAQ